MEQDYLIAGHRIRVEGDRLVQRIEALPGFPVFKTKSGGEPLCQFITTLNQAPVFEQVYYRSEIDGIVSRFGRYTDGYVFDMTFPDAEPLSMWMIQDARIAYFTGNFAPILLRFACWIAYGVAATPFETVAIHTSTICYQGKAVFFWERVVLEKYAHPFVARNIEGAVLLNDDSPILRIIDGKPWVYGSPWSGKTPCYKNESYPLAACVRLSQATFNKIERLNIAQGYGALHPSCPPCFAYDDALYDSISGTLSNLLSNVPVYHLSCLPDAAAARLSCETIFGVCEK